MKLPYWKTDAGKQWHKDYYQKNREHLKAATRLWRIKNKDKVKANVRTQHFRDLEKARYRKLREAVLKHYGEKCSCCGESEYKFLAIDHIFGGGGKHRRSVGEKNLTRWLKRNNFPEGFQVLCHNCNVAKGLYGSCPHKMLVDKQKAVIV